MKLAADFRQHIARDIDHLELMEEETNKAKDIVGTTMLEEGLMSGDKYSRFVLTV